MGERMPLLVPPARDNKSEHVHHHRHTAGPFRWPRTAQEVMTIEGKQWEWLLAGLDMSRRTVAIRRGWGIFAGTWA
jgi:hypothetical protein